MINMSSFHSPIFHRGDPKIIKMCRLTDAKLKTLVPLMVRFRTVKIGGKQDYGVKGIQDLRMYMEELKVNDLCVNSTLFSARKFPPTFLLIEPQKIQRQFWKALRLGLLST